MLASITPLGERGRQSNWSVTVGAFLLGAVGAGVAAGALLGAAGSLLVPDLGSQARLALLAGAALIALALDASPREVPGPRRQVNERWREQYRGWVWGSAYGAQLGLGVSTVVLSAATYVALAAAFLAAGAGGGALIVGVFGLGRGLQPLTTWGVRGPAQLVRFHLRLGRLRPGARGAGCGLLAAILVLSTAGVLA
jgi:hypothetical protein